MEKVGVQLAADDASSYFKTLKQVNEATSALVKGAQSAAAALGVLETEESQTAKASKTLAGDAKKGGEGLSFLEQAAIGAARKVGELATGALANAGQALLTFVKDGVSAAGDFEGGMNRFAAVTGSALDASGQSLDDFKQLFISLGRDLPVSTAEVQQAAIEMAKGGIDPATIAAGGLRDVLNLAAAGEVGIAEAAEIASKQLGVWVDSAAAASDKAAFLTQASDLLAQAANASTVDVDGLALGLANVGGIAKASGLSFQETVQTVALLSPGFSSAADAGTSFKTFLTRLQPTTDKAAEAMANLGLLTKDGTSAFYDSKGAFIGMDKAADLLQKQLGGLSQAEKTAALNAIFGTDAFRTAALLAEKGGQGFRDMGTAMAGAGTASEQAAKKQQGFNVAMENLGGSLEALQITVFSRALPALTGLINLIASGVNAITNYADATAKGETALSSIATFIENAALPAIYGLEAALTMYAIVQAEQVLPALLASLPAIAAQTAAFIANAAAVAAALAPYALIAAAVAAMAYAWNDFNDKITTATQNLLAGQPFWQNSTQILADFGNASDATRQKLQPLADSIQEQRDLLEQEIESLGRRMAAGTVTDAQYQKEMATINAQAGAIDYASKQLGILVDQEARAAASSMTATQRAADLASATDDLGGQASLTAKDIEDLGKKIEETYAKGAEAVQSYASTQSSFLSDVEKRQADHAAKIEDLEQQKAKATTAEQKQGFDDQIKQANQAYKDQEQAAAESYANQQKAQQAHLGQMLIDYTVAQASLGNISKDKAAEITAGLEKAYGLQATSTASTFLKMAGSIDTFSKDATGDIDDLIGTLRDQQQTAADTQKAMDAYAKIYTAEAVSNFIEQKGNAEDYTRALEDVPEKVTTAMLLPNAENRIDEIKAINRGLDNLPRDVSIRIHVKDEVPPEYKPGSPTPFEIGIRGIIAAVQELSGTAIQLPSITGGLHDVSDGLGDVADTIGDVLHDRRAPDDAYDLGDDILTGLARGIGENIGQAVRSAKAAMQSVISAMEDAWDSHSPSRVAMALGGDAMTGLAIGIANTTGAPTDAAQRSADRVVSAFDAIGRSIAAVSATPLTIGMDIPPVLLPGSPTPFEDGLRGILDALDAIGQNDAFVSLGESAQNVLDYIARLTHDLNQLYDDALQGAADLGREEASAITDFGDLEDKIQAALDKGGLSDYQWVLLTQLKTNLPNQLAGLREEADKMAETDPEGAAKWFKLRQGQILELADLQRQYALATTDEERAQITERMNLLQAAQQKEQELFRRQQEQQKTDMQAKIKALSDAWNKLINDPNITIDDNTTPGLRAYLDSLYQIIVQLSHMAGFAAGGPAPARTPILVGERGPEIIMLDRPGMVIPAPQTRQMLMPMGMSGATTNSSSLTINVDARGSSLSAAEIRMAVMAGVNAAGDRADVRIRTGVG